MKDFDSSSYILNKSVEETQHLLSQSLEENKNDKKTITYESAVHDVFNTKEGKRLIKMWEYYFLTAPVSSLSSTPRHADHREGMNTFIRDWVIGAMQRCKKRGEK